MVDREMVRDFAWGERLMFYSTRRSPGGGGGAKPSWIEHQSFTECEILYHCTDQNHVAHLCCTTPRISTKLKAIDKNLVPRMSKILFFPLLAKYSQRARPKRNAYFIHKVLILLCREKIAQIARHYIRRAVHLWRHATAENGTKLHDRWMVRSFSTVELQ